MLSRSWKVLVATKGTHHHHQQQQHVVILRAYHSFARIYCPKQEVSAWHMWPIGPAPAHMLLMVRTKNAEGPRLLVHLCCTSTYSQAVAIIWVQVARNIRSSMSSPLSHQAAQMMQYSAIVTFHPTNHPCSKNLLVPARRPWARVPPKSALVPSMNRPVAEVPASTFAAD